MINRHAEQPHQQGLPREPTPFIGRDAELNRIGTRLASPTCRLLTLVGPGGIGKTRLAIRVAATHNSAFPDGVAFVPLQGVDSAELFVPAIAEAAGITLHGAAPRDQLLSSLADRHMLLVLDNFEHLLDAVEVVSAILAATERVQLLVTSREALNIQEEWRYPVHGLSLPRDDVAGEFEQSEAVMLFAERARRVRPTFNIQEERAGLVRICRQVEGMPLAIELAAAWTRTLSTDAIADEIERHAGFLTSPLRDLPKRHRSIQAVFESSYERLDAEQRAVFQRLSVFRGSFDRSAAQQVARASIAILAALVDKSLLHRHGGDRYQLHELLRQYAQERLGRVPEEAAEAGRAHCAYYTCFLAERDGRMNGGDQRRATSEIGVELENIRAAWEFAAAQGDSAALRRSADALYLFYQFQSRYQEGAVAFERAIQSLQALDGEDDKVTLAELLVHRGWLAIRLGEVEQAEGYLTRARQLYQALGSPPPPRGMATDPLVPLGVLAHLRGDYVGAMRLGKESLGRAKLHGDHGNLMFAHYVLGNAALAQGDVHLARCHTQEAHDMARRMRNDWFLAYCLNDLGDVACAHGHIAEAHRHYEASYRLRETFDDREGMALALNHLGALAFQRGDAAEARRLFRRSQALYRRVADRGGLATALKGLGEGDAAAGDEEDARDHLAEALRLAAENNLIPLTLSSLVAVAEFFLRLNKTGQAHRLLVFVHNHEAAERATRTRTRELLDHHNLKFPAAPHLVDLETVVARTLAALAPGDASPPAEAATPVIDQPLPEPLTDREIEILCLIAAGHSNRAIAEELTLALGTVKWYTTQIYGKLGVRRRTEAVARAREIGLLN